MSKPCPITRSEFRTKATSVKVDESGMDDEAIEVTVTTTTDSKVEF